MFDGFKRFILRGNVIDLAVGIVIGVAFGNVINALVKDVITPLIGVVAKVPNFSNLVLTIHGSQFMYGDFINTLISFVIMATVVYFFVVLPINTLLSRLHKDQPTEPTTKCCPECLSDIPKDAIRCAHCGISLTSSPAQIHT